MKRVKIFLPLMFLLFVSSMVVGSVSGQAGSAGYKEKTSFTFQYEIESLNYSVRVPKTTPVPVTITSITPITPSGFNMSYVYTYKEINGSIPRDTNKTFSVMLKPVTNASIPQERVDNAERVLELLFLHNFNSTQFNGTLTGTNHPFLGNYTIKWHPTGIINRGVFTTTMNISQDGETHHILARITIGEAPPPGIPGAMPSILAVMLATGVVLVSFKLSRSMNVKGAHGARALAP